MQYIVDSPRNRMAIESERATVGRLSARLQVKKLSVGRHLEWFVGTAAADTRNLGTERPRVASELVPMMRRVMGVEAEVYNGRHRTMPEKKIAVTRFSLGNALKLARRSL